MSAANVVKEARAAGIQLGVDGDDLVLEAPVPPATAVLDALSRYKAEIVTLLRPGPDGWSTEDWRVLFDERAGIVEFDGGQSRPQADVQAFACCIVDWLNRNPERSPAGRCLACGDREHAHNPLLPYARTQRPRLAALPLLVRLVRGPASQGCIRADGNGDQCASRSPY